MKKLILFLAWLIFSTFGSAQSYTSLVIRVLDTKSNAPIEGAEFSIEESGFQKAKTDVDGKAFFNNSVPLGRIHYSCTRKDYIPIDDYFNTTNIEDNTLKIYMEKIPKKDSEKVLVTGEVLLNDGKELINGQVEIRIGNITERSYTDVSGNYSVEIDLRKLLFEADDLIIEVKNGSCKQTVTAKLPKNNYLVKNISVSCNSLIEDNSESNNINNLSIDNWTGAWITELEGLNRKIVLEIKPDYEKGLIGNYSIDDQNHGKIIFNKVESDLISGFFVVMRNNKLQGCGEVVFKLNKQNDFKGYFAPLHLPNDNEKRFWIGTK